MWRWLLVLILAHVIGSYGVELFDWVDNADAYAAQGHGPPLLEVAAAPLRILPLLIRFGSVAWWLSYLLPFGLTALVGLRLIRNKERAWMAFEVRLPSQRDEEQQDQRRGK